MTAPPPLALPAERVLELAAPMLAELGGDWSLVDEPLGGPMLRAGSVGVRVNPTHRDDYRHLDLEIVPNVDQPDVATVADCTRGFAADPVDAARQAIRAWIDTCLVTVLDMIEGRGRLADHVMPDGHGGFAGWHAVVGGTIGWSVDGSVRKQEWFAETMPWSALAPVITEGLDRPHLNGIRMLVGQGDGITECEVRINGQFHEPSTAALAALDWPRTDRFSLARTFVLLVHPD